MEIRQTAPDPVELRAIVEAIEYRPRWTFTLVDDLDRGQGSEGLTLDIVTRGFDSYHPERGENYGVHHYFPVPPAAYNRASWVRWVFDQVLLVERHEAMEFFKLDGDRPFAPNHGPGWDPYIVTQLTTETDRRTSFRGDLNPVT